MPRVIKNTLLDYLPINFNIEKDVNINRIFEINKKNIKKGEIIYICNRDIRAKDNFALQFALNKSRELGFDIKIIHQKIIFNNKFKQNFIDEQIDFVKKIFLNNNIEFIITNDIQDFFYKIKPGLVITDFNPIIDNFWLKNTSCRVVEVDSHNLIPTRFVSNKLEYNAATFRNKFYLKVYNFFTEFDNLFDYNCEADEKLQDFINNKLDYYNEFRNNPSLNYTSGLSKYINWGFISAQRIALKIINSKASFENKEAFLEELLIRRELADNFCFYSNNVKSLNSAPDWSIKSLQIHKTDIRQYLYSKKELENANTHDQLWNATQIQLIREGVISSYLRMYWAKKILEWTKSPSIALDIAIYLNDKYAFDAPSPNGYVGILWAITGLHDRAFKDWKVTGKVRRMTSNSISKKYNLEDYLKKTGPRL